MFVAAFDVAQRPGVVVATSDGFDPCGFRWETDCGMQILNGLFQTGEFVDVADGFGGTSNGGFEVLANGFVGGDRVLVVRRLLATG